MTKVYTKMVPTNNAPGYIVKEFLTKNLTKVLHPPPSIFTRSYLNRGTIGIEKAGFPILFESMKNTNIAIY